MGIQSAGGRHEHHVLWENPTTLPLYRSLNKGGVALNSVAQYSGFLSDLHGEFNSLQLERSFPQCVLLPLLLVDDHWKNAYDHRLVVRTVGVQEGCTTWQRTYIHIEVRLPSLKPPFHTPYRVAVLTGLPLPNPS
jgi:hypothetical protein